MGHDDAKTEIDAEEAIWYPSVRSREELPQLAEPGARCRVTGENALYLFYGGQWRQLPKPPEAR